MSRTKIKKRYSRTAYKSVLALLCGIVVVLIAGCIVLICSVNDKKAEYDEYQRKTNAVSTARSLDDKSRAVYEDVQEKTSLLKDLKLSLTERTTRREELKSEATDRTNSAAEAEAKMIQYMKGLGFSNYEELLEAYNKLLAEN